jgi:hypothetical protein
MTGGEEARVTTTAGQSLEKARDLAKQPSSSEALRQNSGLEPACNTNLDDQLILTLKSLGFS